MNSPRLLKGAAIGVDPFNPLASVVVFQYNPAHDDALAEVHPVSIVGDYHEACS